MSIFRETFPAFIQTELKRRQDGMATRNPAFLHQLNSRSAWVRMTSGVDYEGSSALAKNYVLQGGTLFYSVENDKDKFSQRQGIGNSSAAYSNKSITGESTTVKNRTGIRPMPGITNVAIQSKGAYGSLQEATVTFTCWDIKQLEELEILYMRPGYTVLLEFGWDFAKANGALPNYDILNKEDITLNDAFAQIYELIDQSGGTYDALLGYVKNYNWSARDDGGYDCSTSIISLGEVLESLKCNWVPGETTAFNRSNKGILQLSTNTSEIIESYEKGIIPGLLHELWDSMKDLGGGSTKKIVDPRTSNNYYLYKLYVKEDKNERGGLQKPLGPQSKAEIYITLGSFCDLISTYVLPKGAKNQPLSEVVTYATDYKSKSYIKYSKEGTTSNEYAISLKCIASPLALSTNLGVCYVRNDNWNNLSIQTPEDTISQSTPIVVKEDIKVALDAGSFTYYNSSSGKYYPNNVYKRFAGKILKTVEKKPGLLNDQTYYIYAGNLENDIDTLIKDLLDSIKDIKITQETKQISGDKGDYSINFLTYNYIFENGKTFTYNSTSNPNLNTLDLLSFFGPDASSLYNDLFLYVYDKSGKVSKDTSLLGLNNEDPFEDSDFLVKEFPKATKQWDKQGVLDLIQKKFSKVPLNSTLQQLLENQTPVVANQVAQEASAISSKFALPFLETNNSNTKQLGYISNIYVNLNYLYEQAVSKNTASNDTQNKNTISIRDYIQGIMRDVQNSLGNVNSFDIQVDNRNAIGRIIDINFTGNPTDKLFTLQLHNLNSVVRDYKFSSKIFPEMGSIIAISAQDATGIGKLGYDNATLVAWNEGIKDRLIPKKDFNSAIALSKSESPASFILPFLTKIYNYFQYINGDITNKSKDNNNYAYGGLDFAYRDFLSNLDRFDPRNKFKTIIPTELTITLDGIGGIIIGNLFKINQDIVPKGYRNIQGRDIAYIVTRLGHQISGNDWITELSAFPIVFENTKGIDVWKKWDNNAYPGATIINVGGRRIVIGDKTISTCNFNQTSYSEAVNFFIGKGYSKEATAALVGSFLQESRLIPQAVNVNSKLAYNANEQTYAAGIAQWVGPRRVELLKYAKSQGISISNYNEAVKIKNNSTKTPNSGEIIKNAFTNIGLKTQLEFVNKEAPTYPGFSDFKTSTDLSSAILWVYETYEGGNYTEGAAVGNREGYALDIINRLAGKPCGSAAPTITSTAPTTPQASPTPSKPAPSKPAPSPSPIPSPIPSPTPSAAASWKAGEYVVTGVEQKKGVIVQYDVIKDTTLDHYTIKLKSREGQILDEINVGPSLKADVIAQAKQEALDLL